MGRVGKYSSAALAGLKSFTEAMNARVEAYTSRSYQCPWSQRSPQFMFSDFGLKQYYDAANTGCCDDQIRPFASKPQYAETSSAMTPKECYRTVTLTGCSNLQAPSVTLEGCGDTTIEGQFNVICPGLCSQFVDLPGTSYSGKYGKFTLVAKDTEEDWVIRYQVKSEIRSDAYNRCVGEIEHKEFYCEFGSVKTRIKASLSDPDGCYCDCCGVNGLFPAPTHQWVNASIGNTYSAGVSVSPILSTACKNGKISSGYGAWSDGLGSMDFTWINETSYVSDGITHFVARTGSLGDRNHPACCGFDYAVTGSDGCGWSGVFTGSVPRKAALPSLSPSWAEWTPGYYRNIYLNGCCIDSDKNSLSVTRNCLENTPATVSKAGEQVTWTAMISLTESHSCSGCCGNGSLSVNYNDGCNRTGSGNIIVRKGYGSNVTGHVYRCGMENMSWVYQRVDLNCQGGETSLWTKVGGGYPTWESCDEGLREGAIIDAETAPGCRDKECMYVAENGITGPGRRVAAICVKDTQCCKIGNYNYYGEWITDGGECCNKDGTAA